MDVTTRLGDVATRILFENERVKVWEMLLEPGESSDPHRHAMDYLLCILEGESVDADFPDGTSIHLPVERGDVFYIPRGRTETAVNRSASRYREILIEPTPDLGRCAAFGLYIKREQGACRSPPKTSRM